jgi:GNAT superfamily N-acetyltransferase
MRKRIFRALVRPLVDRQVYECLTLNWPATVRPSSGEPAAGVEVKELQHAELARLRSISALEVSEKFVRSLAPRPDRCFGAFVGDALVSYVFFAPASPTAIDEHLRFQFPRGWIYVYKAFTLPAWRGKRLLPHLLIEAMSHLQQRQFVTLVVSENRNSRKAFEHCGFQLIERFPVWRVMSRPVRLTTPVHPGFCIDDRASPIAA